MDDESQSNESSSRVQDLPIIQIFGFDGKITSFIHKNKIQNFDNFS